MKYAVRIQDSADADFQTIHTYFEREAVPAQFRPLSKILAKIYALETAPRLGRISDLDPDFRQVIAATYYIIFYQVDEERKAVEVHHVWDSRRNLARLLEEERQP